MKGKTGFMKRFLLGSFIIGCLFYIVSALIIVLYRAVWMSLMQNCFHIDAVAASGIVLYFLISGKLITIFLMLVLAFLLRSLSNRD